MYSPFTPIHHYTKEQIDQLPKKHSIIDLSKAVTVSAAPDEILEMQKSIQLLIQEKVSSEKSWKDSLRQAEQRADGAELLVESLEKRLEK